MSTLSPENRPISPWTLHSNSEYLGPSNSSFHEEQSIVVIDGTATIQHVSQPARQMLALKPSSSTGESFFDCVHPEHLNRVKWDLAEMTVRGTSHLTWLLRLKTGLGPWQWFKLHVVNRLDRPSKTGIVLQLFERGR